MEVLTSFEQIMISLGFKYLTLQSVFLVLFMPISMVYLFGRGLNLLKTRLLKNSLAIFTIVVFSICEVMN
jgi:hypothetical protein